MTDPTLGVRNQSATSRWAGRMRRLGDDVIATYVVNEGVGWNDSSGSYEITCSDVLSYQSRSLGIDQERQTAYRAQHIAKT